MDSQLARRRLQECLVALSESDLTIRVLVPLFSALGFTRVDYHGGPYEHGKDLVLTREDEFGDAELAVVQVKKYKPSARAGDKNSFSEIVTQLSQCAENPVPLVTGEKRRPSRVFLVTPFVIDTRALQSRYEGARALIEHHGLKILDGDRLVALVIKQLPDVAQELLGPEFRIVEELGLSAPDNTALSAALDLQRIVNIAAFYCDIDFAVGRYSTRLLFSLSASGVRREYYLNLNDWNSVRDAVLAARSIGLGSILSPEVPELDETMGRARTQHEEATSLLRDVQNAMSPVRALITSAMRSARAGLRTFTESSAAIRKAIQHDRQKLTVQQANLLSEAERLGWDRDALPAIESLPDSLDEKPHNLLKKIIESEQAIKDLDSELLSLNISTSVSERLSLVASEIERVIASSPLNLSVPASRASITERIAQRLGDISIAGLTDAKELQRIIDSLSSAKDSLSEFLRHRHEETARRAAIPELGCKAIIDGVALNDWLRRERQSVQERVATFNETPPSSKDLRTFLTSCEKLFLVADQLLSSSQLKDAIGVPDTRLLRLEDQERRLRISVHEVFRTGLNILLLGHAGAGKTTSLQMYARACAESSADPNRRLVLFLPLANLFRSTNAANEERDVSTVTSFLDRVARFVAAKSNSFNRIDLEKMLRERGLVMLVDGLDEVVQVAPHLPVVLSDLANQYSRMQVIASSRWEEGEVFRLPFHSLTLLPFTSDQRRQFVTDWFQAAELPERLGAEVNNHLDSEPAIARIVTSPLLATILCVLAEHGVPLPDRESRLYEEWFRLMLGHYDTHKHIRRLESTRHTLELVARRVAFELHCAGVRDATSEWLVERLSATLKPRLEKEAIVLAVRELELPCNVLVRVSIDAKLGFEHLRYQEFLVASELKLNRSLDVLQLAGSGPWWRGALFLFAQMVDDLEWVVQQTAGRELSPRALDAVRTMVSARPPREQARLRELMVARDELFAPYDPDWYELPLSYEEDAW